LRRVLLLIDNYDSFTYNLVHALREVSAGLEVHVARNDALDVEAAAAMRPSWLVISPGPRSPRQTGICPALIRRFRGRVPILGVCLGHQVIADEGGMSVHRHDAPIHGKTSEIHHDGRGLFGGLPNPFAAARYHSLIVDRHSVGHDYEVSAWTAAGEVMGLRWRGDGAPGTAPLDGVQFHPESYLTPHGQRLLANFLLGAASRENPAQLMQGRAVGNTRRPRSFDRDEVLTRSR